MHKIFPLIPKFDAADFNVKSSASGRFRHADINTWLLWFATFFLHSGSDGSLDSWSLAVMIKEPGPQWAKRMGSYPMSAAGDFSSLRHLLVLASHYLDSILFCKTPQSLLSILMIRLTVKTSLGHSSRKHYHGTATKGKYLMHPAADKYLHLNLPIHLACQSTAQRNVNHQWPAACATQSNS